MRVLVLGCEGMLGSAVTHTFQSSNDFSVYGTTRSGVYSQSPSENKVNFISNVDVLNQDILMNLFDEVRPQLTINCIGIIKQLNAATDPLLILPVNAMFPHRLAKLCKAFDSRLIHVSTDCVFSGTQGNYKENDVSDAVDLYGKSKFIGEISNLSHVVTVLTSMIGHDLKGLAVSLVDWFLSQDEAVKGYSKAIFSGLTTYELANVFRDVIAPRDDLSGLYHVASKPVNKYDLLKLIAEIYEKKISIVMNEDLVIDRSLNASKFKEDTGYVAPEWPELITNMYQYYLKAHTK